MNLFNIDARIEDLLQSAIDPETGEIIDEGLFDELNALELERPKKIENSALFIKSQRALSKALAGEIASLRARKNIADKLADGTERYLALALNGEKFSTPKVAISWRKSQAVKVSDMEKLPKNFVRYKDPEPDKAAIREALKKGKEVPGAELVESTNLVLR